MARAAHAAGTIITSDIDNIYEGLPELLPLIDVLITSAEFPHRLTGISDELCSAIFAMMRASRPSQYAPSAGGA